MIKPKVKMKTGYKYGFRMPEKYTYKSTIGLTRKAVEELSEMKAEPSWMREFRLRAFDIFEQKIMPVWGANLVQIDFSNIYSFVRSQNKQSKTWADVSPEIKKTFDRLGIPEAEKKYLAGVSAQYESEVVYSSVQDKLAKQGILFCDTDTAVKKYPDIVKKYLGTAIPSGDNKFAALNSAFWSGGSFVYIPAGKKVELPLQAYFRINAARMGQFERTLIIAEPGSSVHYVEGCTAPIYSRDSLHAAVVEIFVQKEARVRYTTIQNWSNNVYNLVTKRAFVEENGIMEWVDGNLGSKVTMKYPSVFLRGRGAKGEVLSLAVAGKGQHQDAGDKMILLAPDTSSTIISKSISFSGGRTSYRGLVKVSHNAKRVKSFVRCDALLLDEQSRSDTYPTTQTDENDAVLAHEASVAKLGDEQLFYLRSRGLNEAQATSLIINGFIEPIVKELPMEYASELNRLIEMQMEGSVG